MIDPSVYIKAVSTWLDHVSGGNHFLAVALFGVIAVVFRRTPLIIYNFIKRQLLFTVRMSTAYDTGAPRTMHELLSWHRQSRWAKYSKSIQLRDNGETEHERIITGIGRHFFFREGVLFWMSVSLAEQKGDGYGNQNNEMQIVVLTTFTWNQIKLRKLLLSLYTVDLECPPTYAIDTQGYHSGRFILTGHINKFYGAQKQMIDNVYYQEMYELIDRFVNNKQWYADNGIKHKEAFLLYGEPGTGKTTVFRHFCSIFNIPMVTCSPGQLSALRAELTMRKEPIAIVLEDIDTTSYLCADDPSTEEEDDKRSPLPYPYGRGFSANLSDRSIFLNFFDGITPLDNVLVFASTNHIEKIHSSVYRIGRFDHMYNISFPTMSKVAEILEWDYDDERMKIVREVNLRNYPLAILAQLRIARTPEETKQLLAKGEQFFKLEALSGVKYINQNDLDAA